MNVNIWGPELWNSLHTITAGLPHGELSPSQRKATFNLFSSLQDLLPCKLCRDSYTVFFRLVPLKMFIADGGGVFYWLYLMHTLVNAKLQVSCNPPFLKVLKKYEARRVEKMTEAELNRWCRAIEFKYSNKGNYIVSRVIRLCTEAEWDFNLICKIFFEESI